MAKKECKSCDKNPLSDQWGLMLFSAYLFATAIYGNIKLYEYISSLF